jgi:hypothetical protein
LKASSSQAGASVAKASAESVDLAVDDSDYTSISLKNHGAAHAIEVAAMNGSAHKRTPQEQEADLAASSQGQNYTLSAASASSAASSSFPTIQPPMPLPKPQEQLQQLQALGTQYKYKTTSNLSSSSSAASSVIAQYNLASAIRKTADGRERCLL